MEIDSKELSNHGRVIVSSALSLLFGFKELPVGKAQLSIDDTAMLFERTEKEFYFE